MGFPADGVQEGRQPVRFHRLGTTTHDALSIFQVSVQIRHHLRGSCLNTLLTCRLLELSTSTATHFRRYDSKRAASLQWEYRARQQLQLAVRAPNDRMLCSLESPAEWHLGQFGTAADAINYCSCGINTCEGEFCCPAAGPAKAAPWPRRRTRLRLHRRRCAHQ